MTKAKCCKTCIFSRWWLTKNGRLFKDAIGRCTVEIPDLMAILPTSVTESYGFQAVPHRNRIRPEIGEHCPLYQVNEGKLIDERESSSPPAP